MNGTCQWCGIYPAWQRWHLWFAMICSWKPGAPYPFRCWGLRQSHQQTVKISVVQSAGWQGNSMLELVLLAAHTPHTVPLTTAKDLGRHKPVAHSLCLMQPPVKSLSSLFLHMLHFSKLSSEYQSSGRGHNPAPPLSLSRRGKWSKVKRIDWTLKERIHLANNKVI